MILSDANKTPQIIEPGKEGEDKYLKDIPSP